MVTSRWIGAIAVAATVALANAQPSARVDYFDVPAGSHPHDVAAVPASGGPVYFTEQASGRLGILDPSSGKSIEIALGEGSAPHGVIVAADGAAWVTDGARNEIVRVAAGTHVITRYALPTSAPDANLNTPTFDRRGRLWFTGQRGYYGRVDPSSGHVDVWRAPGGPGAYGMTTTPSGEVYYASLAGNHIARIDVETGKATVIEPPTPDQGARRVWSDSKGNIWVSYWNSGKVGRYDPATPSQGYSSALRASEPIRPRGGLSGSWREWPLPGHAHVYAVWVDPDDKVWLTDWSANAVVRFDPATQRFESFPSNRPHANVRELQGRAGEVWGAESGNDRLVRISWR